MTEHKTLRSAVALIVLFLAACGGGGSSSSTTPAPTNLQYPSPPAFVVQQAITPLTPTVTGQVTSYSVNPALPAGLVISASSGVISGTPTAPTGDEVLHPAMCW